MVCNMTERYYEVEDSPISAIGRKARIWNGSSSRPFPWSEVFHAGIPIDRRKFDELRAISAEFSA